MKKIIAFLTSLALLLCFGVVAYGQTGIERIDRIYVKASGGEGIDSVAERVITVKDTVTTQCFIDAEGSMSCLSEQAVSLPGVVLGTISSSDTDSASAPFAYTEKNKVVTRTLDLYADEANQNYLATLTMTVRGVWSQLENYSVINSVEASLSNDTTGGDLTVFYDIEDNRAQILVVQASTARLFVTADYELAVNGRMSENITTYTY